MKAVARKHNVGLRQVSAAGVTKLCACVFLSWFAQKKKWFIPVGNKSVLRLPSREGLGYMRERQLDMYSLALETRPMGLQFLVGAKKISHIITWKFLSCQNKQLTLQASVWKIKPRMEEISQFFPVLYGFSLFTGELKRNWETGEHVEFWAFCTKASFLPKEEALFAVMTQEV